MPRCRNSVATSADDPHIGNYRLLKTIGKGNFAKVKLARHVLTGKEVSAPRGSSSLISITALKSWSGVTSLFHKGVQGTRSCCLKEMED